MATDRPWREPGTPLSCRHRWHFDLHGTKPTWNFGLFGESLFVTEQGEFYCHDLTTDSEHVAQDLAQVEAWIGTRTVVSADRPSAVAQDVAPSFDWKMLTTNEFRLLVSWLNGTFTGGLPSYADALTVPMLQELINGAAAQVCTLYGAPPELAAESTIRVELNQSAVPQLRQPNFDS